MNGFIRGRTVKAAILGLSLAGRAAFAESPYGGNRPDAPDVPVATPHFDEPTVTVREKGRPDRQCVVLTMQECPDGSKIYRVKAIDNGEVIALRQRGNSPMVRISLADVPAEKTEPALGIAVSSDEPAELPPPPRRRFWEDPVGDPRIVPALPSVAPAAPSISVPALSKVETGPALAPVQTKPATPEVEVPEKMPTPTTKSSALVGDKPSDAGPRVTEWGLPLEMTEPAKPSKHDIPVPVRPAPTPARIAVAPPAIPSTPAAPPATVSTESPTAKIAVVPEAPASPAPVSTESPTAKITVVPDAPASPAPVRAEPTAKIAVVPEAPASPAPVRAEPTTAKIADVPEAPASPVPVRTEQPVAKITVTPPEAPSAPAALRIRVEVPPARLAVEPPMRTTPAPIALTAPGHSFVGDAKPSVIATARPMPPVAQPPAPPMEPELLKLQELKRTLETAILPSQRIAAAEALVYAAPGHVEDVRSILMSAAQDDPAGCVRATCVHSLAKLRTRGQAFVDLLDAAQDDTDSEVREEAAFAMQKVSKK
jgi:hypothetical protein